MTIKLIEAEDYEVEESTDHLLVNFFDNAQKLLASIRIKKNLADMLADELVSYNSDVEENDDEDGLEDDDKEDDED